MHYIGHNEDMHQRMATISPRMQVRMLLYPV